ncbi:MAG: ribosome assembly RNA-binding protein YhbY [Gammaproteobacteria bacterium]|jgi:RNA-binding protein
MPLTAAQKRHLRTLAQQLRPVVMVGQRGLGDSVVAELDGALDAHELLKVKVAAGDREERAQLVETMADRTGAEVVQRIGHVAVLFRRNRKKPKVALPAG